MFRPARRRAVDVFGSLSKAVRRDVTKCIAIWFVFGACTWGLLYWSILPARFSLAAGEVASADIPSPKDAPNWPATERLREEAQAAVPEVYYEDPKVAAEAQTRIIEVFGSIRKVRQRPEEAADLLPRELLLEHEIAIDREVAAAFAEADNLAIEKSERAVRTVVSDAFSAGIKPDGLDSRRKQVDTELLALNVPREMHPFLSELAKRCLAPNLLYDEEETQRRRQKAADAVEPVRFVAGEIIVRKGEKLTEEHIAILRDLGLLRTGTVWREALGSGLLVAVIFGILFVFIKDFSPAVHADPSRLFLLGLVMVFVLVLGRAFSLFSPYLVPIAAAAMILAVLFDGGTALMASLALSLLASAMRGQDMILLFMGVTGSATAVFAVAHLGRRADLVTSGIRVSVANAIAVTATLAMGRASWAETETWITLGWAGINGVICGIVALGVIPYVEAAFGIVTSIKLLDLANPNHPLLKRLLVEAPGTYHHSIMVANLAEAGTEAIGGNSLLARVGAYYHDVGKLKRPYFFIDNQIGMENPHDKMSPTLSAIVITSHVKDGIELARAHRLPEQVTSFIRTHHGTTLVSYFYSKARDGDGGADVSEEDFRYEGPKPTTRETAIVMLADSVEAAVRSLVKPTPARIETMVNKIFAERLGDHQLDLCDLTLRDLDEVARTFSRMLAGVFHSRVEYSDPRKDQALKAQEREPERGSASCQGSGS